jgi:hypothetical protein
VTIDSSCGRSSVERDRRDHGPSVRRLPRAARQTQDTQCLDLSPWPGLGRGLVSEVQVGNDAVGQDRSDLVRSWRAVEVDLYTDIPRARVVKESLEYLRRSDWVVYRRDVRCALASIKSHANVRASPKVVSPGARSRYDEGAVRLFVPRNGEGVGSPALAARHRQEDEVLAGESVPPRSQQCGHDRIQKPEQRLRRSGVFYCWTSHTATLPDRITRRKAQLRSASAGRTVGESPRCRDECPSRGRR